MMKPKTTIKDNFIRSTEHPFKNFKIAKQYTYTHNPQIISFKNAWVESYIFVDADEVKNIRGFVWVQFEGFLPEVEKTYRYNISDKLVIGGREFLWDVQLIPDFKTAIAKNPNSDGAKGIGFLQSLGYTLGQDLVSHRLIWLDEAKRSEVIISLIEDSRQTGFSAEEMEEGPTGENWNKMVQGIQQRALNSFSL